VDLRGVGGSRVVLVAGGVQVLSEMLMARHPTPGLAHRSAGQARATRFVEGPGLWPVPSAVLRLGDRHDPTSGTSAGSTSEYSSWTRSSRRGALPPSRGRRRRGPCRRRSDPFTSRSPAHGSTHRSPPAGSGGRGPGSRPGSAPCAIARRSRRRDAEQIGNLLGGQQLRRHFSPACWSRSRAKAAAAERSFSAQSALHQVTQQSSDSTALTDPPAVGKAVNQPLGFVQIEQGLLGAHRSPYFGSRSGLRFRIGSISTVEPARP
jgi:hypothetical protein